ncbi:hypothetical protein [Paenibacillus naphthalenovorans]|uniref:hypothetical protein n=1 Tax=Paenibacillus naphthalenovorans TaxID=162209 RepID=UPI003D2C065E
MKKRRRLKAVRAKMWVGQFVCAVLNDGSYYMGNVIDVKNGKMVLSGVKGNGRLPLSVYPTDKAKISGLLGSLFGGQGGSNPLGALQGNNTGGQGFLGNMWPKIRFGIGMVGTVKYFV